MAGAVTSGSARPRAARTPSAVCVLNDHPGPTRAWHPCGAHQVRSRILSAGARVSAAAGGACRSAADPCCVAGTQRIGCLEDPESQTGTCGEARAPVARATRVTCARRDAGVGHLAARSARVCAPPAWLACRPRRARVWVPAAAEPVASNVLWRRPDVAAATCAPAHAAHRAHRGAAPRHAGAAIGQPPSRARGAQPGGSAGIHPRP